MSTWQGMTTAEHLADCERLEAERKAPAHHMSSVEREVIEAVLYAYCCCRQTAGTTHKQLKTLGYDADLRCFVGNSVEVIHLASGVYTWVEC